MILYYIRHGDPVYNPDSLTELGHKQANALAKRLSLYGLNEVYVSTSNRAILTAKPTCEALSITPIECPWAHEALAWESTAIRGEDDTYTWAFSQPSIIEKFHTEEIRRLGADWYLHPAFANTNFVKGIPTIHQNVDAFLRSLGFEHDRKQGRFRILKENKKRVALFAHQGFGIAFLSSLLDIPYPAFCTRFDLGHSSMTVINFEEHNGYAYPKILQLSNDSHLYKEGILTGYNNSIDI